MRRGWGVSWLTFTYNFLSKISDTHTVDVLVFELNIISFIQTLLF